MTDEEIVKLTWYLISGTMLAVSLVACVVLILGILLPTDVLTQIESYLGISFP